MTAATMERFRAAGLLASDSAVARVTGRRHLPGAADNARVLEAVVAGALRFDVRATRGFDIGSTEFAGQPLSW
jgi:hypothetical protein